jgi:protein-serine/threonine kinase
MNALKHSPAGNGDLHVVNGISTNTSSSLLTTAAKENFIAPYNIDGLPGVPAGRVGGPRSHPQIQENEVLGPVDPLRGRLESPPVRPINPSLSTLEKAVATRIFFENLYFPLFRHPPSREQRRLAMERDMSEMQLSHDQKERLRARWRQNESDYLRERRQKVDVSAFIQLKVIGHGTYKPCSPLSTLSFPCRRLWCCFLGTREVYGKPLCHETSMK